MACGVVSRRRRRMIDECEATAGALGMCGWTPVSAAWRRAARYAGRRARGNSWKIPCVGIPGLGVLRSAVQTAAPPRRTRCDRLRRDASQTAAARWQHRGRYQSHTVAAAGADSATQRSFEWAIRRDRSGESNACLLGNVFGECNRRQDAAAGSAIKVGEWATARDAACGPRDLGRLEQLVGPFLGGCDGPGRLDSVQG